jgi:hypothetical protein
MEYNEVIFDLKLEGALSHRTYEKMVETWKNPNQAIPSIELCLETWNNISLPRLTAQRMQERILEVKSIANEILRLEHDWKVAKQYTTEYWTPEEFLLLNRKCKRLEINLIKLNKKFWLLIRLMKSIAIK